MDKIKLLIILSFAVFILPACFKQKPERFVIADSKLYEASLFRQNCAICHGPEGEGQTLENGTKVPSLREGEFKFHTEQEIYKQIAGGGNGMTPFRDILTERELDLMANFVHDKLRKP
jgi:mono/diheme cytochrome c family protein